MMKMAVFMHTRLSGGSNIDTGASVDPVWGRQLFVEQICALVTSGLAEAADEIYIGLNGNDRDMAFVSNEAPLKAKILQHGENAKSLLPTMQFLQSWLPGHEDWAVCFFHAKGACHPGDPLTAAWRRCMTHHLIDIWRKCVADLELGFDTVGCHWLSPKQYPRCFVPFHETSTPYWGGAFWWATGRFLLQLPKLPEKIERRHHWFLPELLIGSGPTPRIVDYHRAFPNLAVCQQSSKL
jgi:hypothetical protein